jgi:hypothetical protein
MGGFYANLCDSRVATMHLEDGLGSKGLAGSPGRDAGFSWVFGGPREVQEDTQRELPGLG